MPHITTTDQAALIREIRAERRIELFFEEHRFFDIRRWQQPDGNLEDILHLHLPADQDTRQRVRLLHEQVPVPAASIGRGFPLGVDYRHELAESRMVAANFFNGFKTDKRDDT